MISHAHRCIFIHQRKCAGTSIISAFGVPSKDKAFHIYNDGTLSDDEVVGHWYARDRQVRDYFVFAVVRNPWDRFISGWKYLAKTSNRPLNEIFENLPRKGHDYRHLVRPQLDTLVDRDGKFVPDFVIRYEKLSEGFDEVCRRLGVRLSLPHLNSGSHDPYWTYYQDRTRELVQKLFAKDIEFFGYRFGE